MTVALIRNMAQEYSGATPQAPQIIKWRNDYDETWKVLYLQKNAAFRISAKERL